MSDNDLVRRGVAAGTAGQAFGQVAGGPVCQGLAATSEAIGERIFVARATHMVGFGCIALLEPRKHEKNQSQPVSDQAAIRDSGFESVVLRVQALGID